MHLCSLKVLGFIAFKCKGNNSSYEQIMQSKSRHILGTSLGKGRSWFRSRLHFLSLQSPLISIQFCTHNIEITTKAEVRELKEGGGRQIRGWKKASGLLCATHFWLCWLQDLLEANCHEQTVLHHFPRATRTSVYAPQPPIRWWHSRESIWGSEEVWWFRVADVLWRD